VVRHQDLRLRTLLDNKTWPTKLALKFTTCQGLHLLLSCLMHPLLLVRHAHGKSIKIIDKYAAYIYFIPDSGLLQLLPFVQADRAENVRSMLDLKPIELYAVLRKNPGIFLMEASETRARYNAIHKVGCAEQE